MYTRKRQRKRKRETESLAHHDDHLIFCLVHTRRKNYEVCGDGDTSSLQNNHEHH